MEGPRYDTYACQRVIAALLRRAHRDGDLSFLLCDAVLDIVHELGVSKDVWRKKVMPNTEWITLFYVQAHPDQMPEIRTVQALDREETFRLEKAIPETNGRVVIKKTGSFHPFAKTRNEAIRKAKGRLQELIRNNGVAIDHLKEENTRAATLMTQLDCLTERA